MSQMLPDGEFEMWLGHPYLYMNKITDILNTPDDSDIGYFIEVELKYPDELKQKTKKIPFCPENKNCNKGDFSDYLTKNLMIIHRIKR